MKSKNASPTIEGTEVQTDKHVEYQGEPYAWNEKRKSWHHMKTGQNPPASVAKTLDSLKRDLFASDDEHLTDTAELLKRAIASRECGNFTRAEALARRVLSKESRNAAAGTIMAAVYRSQGEPQKALSESEKFRTKGTADLFTTRAAALCDLDRWEEAKEELAKAFALEKKKSSPETASVMYRIRKAKPELYAGERAMI